MEFMTNLWSQISAWLNVPYLLTFILLTYLIKKYLKAGLEGIIKRKIPTVFIVLFFATILAIPFLAMSHHEDNWVRILLSYAVGTSLHEVIFTWIEKRFTS